MNEHTPGPWRATTGHLVRVMAGADSVAGIHKIGRFTGSHDPRETIANAHLIAAAPELLAALELMINEAGRLAGPKDMIAAIAVARAASAKASPTYNSTYKLGLNSGVRRLTAAK